jgi:hypothetical protein
MLQRAAAGPGTDGTDDDDIEPLRHESPVVCACCSSGWPPKADLASSRPGDFRPDWPQAGRTLTPRG